MTYEVKRGDTIAKVTSLMNTDWQTLKKMNPQAVGRSSQTKNWFLKEGSLLQGPESFEAKFAQSLKTVEKIGQEHKTPEIPDKSAKALTPKALPEKDKELQSYTIKPGDSLWRLAVKRFRVNLEDLIQVNNIEDPNLIQPGQVIRIPERRLPAETTVVASWYGRDYHGRPMANGEFYNMYSNTIAHKDLPFGTRVELTNPETGQRAHAVVKDRGPFVEGRDVDLSYSLARRLSLVEKGVGRLHMKVLG
jgi:rare lipoprotein A